MLSRKKHTPTHRSHGALLLYLQKFVMQRKLCHAKKVFHLHSFPDIKLGILSYSSCLTHLKHVPVLCNAIYVQCLLYKSCASATIEYSCVYVCMRACVRACAHVCVCVCVCVCAHDNSTHNNSINLKLEDIHIVV